MFCPQCGTEYREGFETCADCHVPLVDHPILWTNPNDEEGGDFTTVLATDDPFVLETAVSWLRSADIPHLVDNETKEPSLPGRNHSEAPHPVTPLARVRVRTSDEGNARDLLDQLRKELTSHADKEVEEEDDNPVPGGEEEEEIYHFPENTRVPASTQAPACFRFVVLLEAVLALVLMWFGSIPYESAPVDVKNYLDSLRVLDLSAYAEADTIRTVEVFLRIAAAAGLVMFFGPARHLYVLLYVWTVAHTIVQGGYFTHGVFLGGFCLDLFLQGIVVALAYSPGVGEVFRGKVR